MAASDNLNQQLFHGTARDIEDEILPGYSPVHPSMSEKGYVYATPDVGNAWMYAELAWNARPRGRARVYQVEPTGEMEKDPQFDAQGNSRSNFASDLRSRSPLRIIREVPLPGNMGDPEEWDD